jgi:hypothetical protein
VVGSSTHHVTFKEALTAECLAHGHSTIATMPAPEPLGTVGPRFGDVPVIQSPLICGTCGSRRCHVIVSGRDYDYRV